MLDRNSLSQLNTLKQQLHEAIDRAEGTVKGTQGRFGFVILDDGREVFLDPEQMLKVFPDDRVAVKVVPPSAAETAPTGKKPAVKGARGAGQTGAAKGGATTPKKARPHAELEKLLDSPLREFTGRYAIKGSAHFVIPDLPRLSRWLFLPPNARGKAQAGDFVAARIRRHPFRDGKPQAEITARLGAADTPFIESDYAAAYWQLPPPEAAPAAGPSPLLDGRSDLTGLPLVTIDGDDTQDIDDALCAEATSSGWKLWVAIADPLPWLASSPEVGATARARATSIYLPGQVRHMLPVAIACEASALQPEQLRPALVCELDIDAAGVYSAHRWHSAMIRSRARLTYRTLSARFGDGSVDAGLAALAAVAAALRSQRESAQLVMPDRADYELQLDGRGRLADIVRRDKTVAHGIVEECMIAANRCAAATIGDSDGIYVTHAGFRPERLGDVRALVQQYLPDLTEADPASLEGYVDIMRAAAAVQCERPLRAVLSRWLERARLSRQPAPHFGMGLARYTTATSPLRKYNDLMLHQLLARQRGDASFDAPQQSTLDAIQALGDRARRAGQLAEQWLKTDWLAARHKAEPGQPRAAEIHQINSRGASVRLLDCGIEGQLDLSGAGRKFRFDAKVLELDGGDQRLQLEQQLNVVIGAIDTDRHTVSFLPAPDGSG